MVRRVLLWALLTVPFAVAVFVAQGCVDDSDPFESDCDKRVPLKCCQCSLPDVCPPWADKWPTLPAWCEPILADAGIDVYGDIFGDGSTSFCSSGTCVPPAPDSWKQVAFAMTWPNDPPACPAETPEVAFEGSPAPPDLTCPACSCDAPEGTCSLPASWTISSTTCNVAGGVQTNFDPPGGWDGSCDSASAIAPGKLCGGVPCVQSLTLSLPTIEEKPCTSHVEGQADLPILRARSGGPEQPIGRACTTSNALPPCTGGVCVPTQSSFSACIMHDGNQVCPDDWNADRQVLYKQIDDARVCTPCGCDAPSGSSCQVKWRIFSGPGCSAQTLENVISADMMSAGCTYLDPGIALSGKTAEILDYTKGSCAPTGGKLEGDVWVDGEVTVCCRSMTM